MLARRAGTRDDGAAEVRTSYEDPVPQEGEVLAVGPGRFDDAGSKRVPVDVKVGDVVLYSKYGGEEYLILSARDVLAVIEK